MRLYSRKGGSCSFKLTISLVVLEEEVAESLLLLPVRARCVLQDPLPMKPRPVGLGVDPQAVLHQREFSGAQLRGHIFRTTNLGGGGGGGGINIDTTTHLS